jgi:L-serine kinase (ADP)
MNDAKTAIVLAAGASRRMGDATADRPKSLLPYKDKPILLRLLDQLGRTQIERIVVVIGYQADKVRALVADRPGVVLVENTGYADDVNIVSMHLALDHAVGSTVIFEADTIMEDAMVTYATGTDFEHQSAWFTKGPFTPDMYGGIVRSDATGKIDDIRVVPKWLPEYAQHSKMTGVMRVRESELPLFRRLVAEYAERSTQQYFFVPWAEHIPSFPAVEGDARHYRFATFNTPDEYARLLATDLDPAPARDVEIELVDPRHLLHIEAHDPARVEQLQQKIEREQVWTKPLYVDTHDLVLDGQHRLEVALRMGLARIPVQRFDYHDVAVWTLRKEEHVDVATVIRRARAGEIYPYKTVKHKFPGVIDAVSIPLAELGQ